MLTLTSSIETPFHRLRAGIKLAALAVFTAVLFALTAPLPLALALVVVLALTSVGGGRFLRMALAMLRPIWPFVAVVAVWHLLTRDATGGAVVILRMVAAVAAANLVTLTTRLSDMMTVIERLARPLASLGLPPERLALAMALVIRFVPVLLIRSGQIGDAFRARSPRRPGWRVLLPATLAALDDADRVAEALRARGGVR